MTPTDSTLNIYGTPKDIAQEMVQDCIARRLRQVNRMVTRLYDDALRNLGLTVNQLNILATVVSQGQMQPGHLGIVLGMEKSTVSRTIDRMAKRGWLEVGPGKDGRSQLLKATQQGRQLLVKAAPVWDELQSGVLDAVGTGGLTLLSGLGIMPEADAPDPTEDFYATEDLAAAFYQ
ncbi:MAG: MarR family winged helix-turn-helix transcriptional regulator [Cyanobacteria bacterium J06648_16]